MPAPSRRPLPAPAAAAPPVRATGRRSGRRVLRITAKVLVATLSVVVLGSSSYGWTQLQRLNDGVSAGNVLDPGAATPITEQNILLVGVDARTDALGNPLPQPLLDQLHAGSSTTDGEDRTDTIILLHISDGGARAIGVSIPRDSYVELADGSGKHKINSAYTAGIRSAERTLRAQGVSGPQLQVQAAEQGARTMIKTVQQLTGLTINHYAAVNLAGFYSISQAIGGVPVCLNGPVRDSYSGANFPAGPQTIDGPQILSFIRQRHELPNGDLDRVRRQQAVLASMANTVLSDGTLLSPSRLNNLTTAVKQAVALDEGWDVLGLIQLLRRVGNGNVEFATIPIVNISLQTPYDGDAVQVDPQQVLAFFRGVTGGNAVVSPVGDGSAVPSSVVPGSPAPGPPITTAGQNCVN